MTYSRSLLVIHFQYSSVYMSIPNSLFIPPVLFPSNHKHILKSVNLFLFCEKVFVSFLFRCRIYKESHTIFLLSSVSITLCRSIHVAANGIISFFLWPSNTPLYIYTASSLSIHLSMDTQVASMTWLL